MELIKGYEGKLKFATPANVTTATFTVEKDGVQIGSPTNATILNGVATADIPYPISFDEGNFLGKLRFIISGQPYILNQPFSVVTPYLDIWEMREQFEGEFTDKELFEAEKAVRYIINSHCGQTFGHRGDTLDVRGNGTGSLRLPERLIKATTFNGVTIGEGWFDVTGDGWYLAVTPRGIPPVRADYYGLHMHRGGVIHNPNNVSLDRFQDNFVFTITGEWGYLSVPMAVKEASKLLLNDYIGGESQYRDRYLTSMTAADWRIQFNAGAFSNTGNVRADQLLSDFVLTRGWAVI